MGRKRSHPEQAFNPSLQLSILDKSWYNGGVKLIVNLKLQPTPVQAKSLRQTLERANAACNWISEQGWQTQPKPTIKQFALHKLCYHAAKEKFDLTAQMVVRAVSKVADAYKLDKKRQRTFKRHGSIAYDDRIIRFTKDEAVNLWTVEGRQAIPFVCGDYQRKLLPFRKGEVDLVFRKGNYYLNAVCEVESAPPLESDDVIGCDFGIVNILTDSDGTVHSGKEVDEIRRTFTHRRRNLQRKGTRAATRKLRQIGGKQADFQRTENHRISKQIVQVAQRTGRAIALEELKGIRDRVTANKKQRTTLSNWGFAQLRIYIEYKSQLAGVVVSVVDPRNTSRQCEKCGCIDKKNRQTQSLFLCISCGYTQDADTNAARNIRVRGLSTSREGLGSVARDKPLALTMG